MPEAAIPSSKPRARKLTLHIGIPKTGSTALQAWFRLNRAQLMSQGVCYPVSPGLANHVLLPAAVDASSPWIATMHPNEFGGLAPEVRISNFRKEWLSEMTSLPEHITQVVISTEYCAIMLTDVGSIQRLTDLLRPHFDDITIVVYLRRQDLHVASVFSERLRLGETDDPRLPDPDLESIPLYDYASLLDRWASVFGERAIRPRIYERQELVGGDVIEDFLACAGIARPKDAVDAPEQNQSLSREGQEFLLRAARRMREQRGEDFMGGLIWRTIAVECTEAMPGQGWRAPRAEAEKYLAHFAAINEQVRARFFPERERLFSAEFSEARQADKGPRADADLDAALRVMESMIARNGVQIAILSCELARQYRRLHELENAKRKLIFGIRLASAHVPARLLLADICIDRGEIAEASEHLNVVLRSDPEHAWARRVAARLAQARTKAT